MKSKGILKHPYKHSGYLFCNCSCEKSNVCRRHVSNYEIAEAVRVLNNTDTENCQHLDFDIEYEIVE